MYWDRFATVTPSMIKSHIFLLLATLIATMFASMLAAMFAATLATMIATLLAAMIATLLASLGAQDTVLLSSSSNQSQVQRREG